MRFEFYIGNRYLKTKKENSFISRISIIAIIVAAIGVMIPVSVMSILNGYHEGIKERHLEKVFHLTCYSSKIDKHKEKIVEELEKKDNVLLATPYIEEQALIRSRHDWQTVNVRGVSENLIEKETKYYENGIIENRNKLFSQNFPIYKEKNDGKILTYGNYQFEKKMRIIIGKVLAEKLLIKIDDIANGKKIPVELIFNDPGQHNLKKPKIHKFLVSGIFSSGYIEYDETMVFISLPSAPLIGFDVNRIGMKLKNKEIEYLRDTEYVSQIRDFFKDNFDFEPTIRTWLSRSENLFFAFDWEKNLMTIVLSIMILASFLTIYLTLNVVVMDKKMEIGILKSMGVSSKSIRIIFILEGLLIGIIGTLIGVSLGILLVISFHDLVGVIENVVNYLMQAIYNSPLNEIFGFDGSKWSITESSIFDIKTLEPKINLIDILLMSAGSILASTLAAYFPSNRAAKQKPVEVLRYE